MTKSKDKIIRCIAEHVDILTEVENLQNKEIDQLEEICKLHCSYWHHCSNE